MSNQPKQILWIRHGATLEKHLSRFENERYWSKGALEKQESLGKGCHTNSWNRKVHFVNTMRIAVVSNENIFSDDSHNKDPRGKTRKGKHIFGNPSYDGLFSLHWGIPDFPFSPATLVTNSSTGKQITKGWHDFHLLNSSHNTQVPFCWFHKLDPRSGALEKKDNMEEILQHLIGRLSHYVQGLIQPRWCRILPSTVFLFSICALWLLMQIHIHHHPTISHLNKSWTTSPLSTRKNLTSRNVPCSLN